MCGALVPKDSILNVVVRGKDEIYLYTQMCTCSALSDSIVAHPQNLPPPSSLSSLLDVFTTFP